MKLLRNTATSIGLGALIVAGVALPATNASAAGHQQWGAWTQVGYTYSIKCRSYVDATTSKSHPGKIYITGAVYCNRAAAIAMVLGPIPGPDKTKNCRNVTESNFCYLSEWIKNPSGKQTFRVAILANHVAKNVKVAHIKFSA